MMLETFLQLDSLFRAFKPRLLGLLFLCVLYQQCVATGLHPVTGYQKGWVSAFTTLNAHWRI